MLLKLIKNDFKFMIKYWWMGAVASLFATIVFIFSYKILSDLTGELLNFAGVMGMFLSFAIWGAFNLMTFILLFIRYYNNFFTDQGYLTFTLPVKRNHLLLSKFIIGFIFTFTTSVISIFEVIFGLIVSEGIRTSDFIYAVEYVEPVNLEGVINFFISSMIFISCIAFAVLLLFVCISFASMLVKRGKLFAAIGIYYGISSVLLTVLEIFYFFGGIWFISYTSSITEIIHGSALTLLLIIVNLFIVSLCVILYMFTHWILDKKLNLP